MSPIYAVLGVRNLQGKVNGRLEPQLLTQMQLRVHSGDARIP